MLVDYPDIFTNLNEITNHPTIINTMSDHYERVKIELQQMKAVESEAAADEEQLSPASVTSVPAEVSFAARRDLSRSSINGRSRSKSRSKADGHERQVNGKQLSDLTPQKSDYSQEKGQSRLSNEQNIKGTLRLLKGKTAANGHVESCQREKDLKCEHHGKEDGSKVAKKRRAVTVDTSKAKTSLEALKMSIRQLKWKEFPMGRRTACDIYWHGVSFHDNENIVSGQVNKFPAGMIEMLRKINLSRAVRTMQELFPEEYNFYPRSWILPEEYQLFSTQIRLLKDNDSTLKSTFIVKPDSGSQGDGIYLIRDPADLRVISGSQIKQAVVQEYIQKPLLIDKLKFDIRLYVLVRSLEPLELYIAKEGLSRFCTEPYQEPSQKNLSHVFMHLTNYSLNVHSGNFVHSDSCSTGSKRTFSSVLYRIASKGVDIKKVWSDIIALVIKTVIALVPELKVHYQADIPPGKPGPTCFQILGFDILLMKNLKPVLLEVSPGVYEYVPSPVDEEVKVGVIRDTLRLMDPAQRKQHVTSNTEGGPPEDAIVVETGSDEKESLTDSLPSLCLKQVFPKYTKQFNYLRVVERIAAIFLRFLGVKGTMRLGPTGFRTFIRQAFIEAFFYLAARRFKAVLLREQVLLLLEVCEGALEGQSHSEKPRPQRSHPTQSSAPNAFSSPARTRRHHLRHQPLQLSAKANTEN
ncbi:Tubulin polyglutamylase TTLL11 [Anabarilius grahami]|uniref:Tubulin polyglutamylase TTLL11 n=1 Tax=Anabarilius grahami TaxID=495550 RepID=A0A3N0XIT3_ANAGA|nr:Tubulin polyglutamylase TTLL11 [Anabarilius grahami]